MKLSAAERRLLTTLVHAEHRLPWTKSDEKKYSDLVFFGAIIYAFCPLSERAYCVISPKGMELYDRFISPLERHERGYFMKPKDPT